MGGTNYLAPPKSAATTSMLGEGQEPPLMLPAPPGVGELTQGRGGGMCAKLKATFMKSWLRVGSGV